MQAIYKPRDCRKIGARQPEREQRLPPVGSPRLRPARGRRDAPEHSSSTRGFLEKELHRRYSKRELHNNKRSVPHLKSQGCIVVFKKRKMTKPQTSI